jgi:dCTP deaminase
VHASGATGEVKVILKKSEIWRLIYEKELVSPSIEDWQVRENGLDLTVGPRVAVAKDCIFDPYHMSRDEIANCFEEAEIPDEGVVLKPGNVYLLHTSEYVRMPDDVVGLANLTHPDSAPGEAGCCPSGALRRAISL